MPDVRRGVAVASFRLPLGFLAILPVDVHQPKNDLKALLMRFIVKTARALPVEPASRKLTTAWSRTESVIFGSGRSPTVLINSARSREYVCTVEIARPHDRRWVRKSVTAFRHSDQV
jgi:hypothetical protein